MRLFSSDIYDIKALRKYLIFLTAFTALSYITKGYVYVLLPFFVLAAAVREKLVDLMFYVILFCFAGIANPYIFPKTPFTFIVSRLSLFTVAGILMLRVAGRRSAKIVTPFKGIFLYVAWAALVSVQGFDPIVSYLKIILFVPIYLALYGVANEVTSSSRVNAKAVRSAVLSIVCMMVLGSALLLPFPSISQLQVLKTDDLERVLAMMAQGHSLFMGITNHSQALGPMLGVLLSLVLGDLVFSVKRWDALYLSLLGIGFLLIVKSSSRTGMGTFVAGSAIVLWLFMRARAVAAGWKYKVLVSALIVAVVAVIAVLCIPSTRNRVLGFALKTNANAVTVTSSDVTFENVTSTRQGLIDEAMRNFGNKPMLGNGFQVSEEMQHVKRNSLLEYMSAPIEKGVWPTAILEEGGIPGLVLFGGFLLVAMYLLIRRHAYIGAATLWAFIIVNLGEFNFFSMSYTGGFEWALVYAAVILDGQRMKNVGLEIWDVPMEQVFEEVGYDEWTRRRA